MSLAGVVFDYSVLLGRGPEVTAQLKTLLENIRGAGLKIVVASTHRKDINGQLAEAGLPHADHLLFYAKDKTAVAYNEVTISKGSPLWMTKAADLIGCDTNQLVSVGDEHCDWTGAIGAAVLHLHAGWVRKKPDDVNTYVASTPLGAWMFITHFLIPPSRFKFSLDLPGKTPVYFRSLYTANTPSKLHATTPSEFNLVQIFTSDRRVRVQVGSIKGGELLMIHTLTSLYKEGLIDPYSRFTVYPGHAPGTYNETLASYVDFLAKNVQAYERDLLIRAIEAPDTSKLRIENPKAVSYQNQTNTVHLNPGQVKNIKDKSVVVFDDFTTDGNGLDWARQLLLAGGARKVVLVTIGKFVRGGNPTQVIHRPAAGVEIRPFELTEYGPDAFECERARLEESNENAALLGRLFDAMRDKVPYAAE
jgi:hypothetical protein